MNSRLTIGGTLVLLFLGCGGSPFTVNGNIRGNSLKSGDAVSGTGAIIIGTITMNAAVVVMSSSSGLCSSASAGRQPKSSQFLTVVMSDRNTNTAPTAPGTYTIWTGAAQPTKLGFANYSKTDASCQEIQSAYSTSGTVTLTSVSSGNLSGTFDITFNSGEHVTGSFSANNCNALVSAIGHSTCST